MIDLNNHECNILRVLLGKEIALIKMQIPERTPELQQLVDQILNSYTTIFEKLDVTTDA